MSIYPPPPEHIRTEQKQAIRDLRHLRYCPVDHDPAETRREAHAAMLDAWAARLDAAKDDADALDDLCAEIDEKVGQGEAWRAISAFADTAPNLPLLRNKRLTAARAAILAIEEPDHSPEERE